jgi:hypothetical protein
MSNPFDIGDVDYSDPENVLSLRKNLIDIRNDCLGPATFEPNLAIILSHVIGLLAAFAKEKWPEYEAAINAQAGS